MKQFGLRQVIPPPIYPSISSVERAEYTTINYVTNFDEQLKGLWDRRRELVLKEKNKDNTLDHDEAYSIS